MYYTFARISRVDEKCAKSFAVSSRRFLRADDIVTVRQGRARLEDLDLRREMISLTVQGKDLVEENIPADPGVILHG